MGSSWRLKSTRGSNAPGEATYSLGRFCNDYEYVERLGDLDANNGRFCVTPEFPNGTYAYFMTTDSNETPTFPYSIGEAYYNVPVEENWKTKSKQDFLPDRVRRRAQNENDQAGELLTSRISGISYGPIQNVEVHQSSAISLMKTFYTLITRSTIVDLGYLLLSTKLRVRQLLHCPATLPRTIISPQTAFFT